jgi:hypothetical protein
MSRHFDLDPRNRMTNDDLMSRWFHKINVFMTKALNLPILIFISLATLIKLHSSSPSLLNAGQVWTGLRGLKWEGKVDCIEELFEYAIDPALLELDVAAKVSVSEPVAENHDEMNRQGTVVGSPLAQVFRRISDPLGSSLPSKLSRLPQVVAVQQVGPDSDDSSTQARLKLIENSLDMILLELRSARGDQSDSRGTTQ